MKRSIRTFVSIVARVILEGQRLGIVVPGSFPNIFIIFNFLNDFLFFDVTRVPWALSADLMLFASVQRMFFETSSLCYPRTLHRQALFERTEKYPICSQYTQIVKLRGNSKLYKYSAQCWNFNTEFNAKPLILTPYDSSKCRTTSAFSQLAFNFFKQT